MKPARGLEALGILIMIQLRLFCAMSGYLVISLKHYDSIGFIKHGNSWCVELFLPLYGSLGTLTAHLKGHPHALYYSNMHGLPTVIADVEPYQSQPVHLLAFDQA